MRRYVLGFYLTPDGVVLIKKVKPSWQKGKWNGIGGSIEQGETPLQAMLREFREEAHIVTTSNQWTELFTIGGLTFGDPNKPWQMAVFMGQTVQSIKHLFPIEVAEGRVDVLGEMPLQMDSTAAWLLPMCWDIVRHKLNLACSKENATKQSDRPQGEPKAA